MKKQDQIEKAIKGMNAITREWLVDLFKGNNCCIAGSAKQGHYGCVSEDLDSIALTRKGKWVAEFLISSGWYEKHLAWWRGHGRNC
tara:strand:+ start:1500 stop:1757 length:258 start_codon:yes stop_codon:yes gene_type:complete